MAGKRKLFIAHAGELANRLVHAVVHDGVVAQFVRAYAERHKRGKLVADAARLRELESTIGREALLVIAVEVRRLVPQAFAQGQGRRDEEETLFAEAFFAEFLASLCRSLEWPLADAPAEAQAFDRDLEMYWGWRQRSASPGGHSSTLHSFTPAESPFRDRCAILLDPPMMEQARRAAAEFEKQAVRLGAQMLGRLGRLPAGTSRKLPRKTGKSSRVAKSRRRLAKSERLAKRARPMKTTRQRKTAANRGKKAKKSVRPGKQQSGRARRGRQPVRY